ncbi:type 4a pilus biogenesis protein PilO [Dokdonella sp. MW10]|uniref:type 4a pilus biogenesis protein PilO n=1 Tax=Dokdonella sp. MW10 TaxID=2992926 RepID=UPI003F8104A6
MSIIDDFRNLDRNNVGGWPQRVKTALAILVVLVIVGLGAYLYILPQQDELELAENREATLKADFAKKQAQVVNLEAYEKQLEDMKEELRQLIGQLPSKTEMPELILAISQAALRSGIETELFQPGPEVSKEGFYAEKPIQLRMVGTYHQFGAFISTVASLERVVILTMHDVALRPGQGGAAAPRAPGAAAPAAPGTLTLEGTVKTYRYLDADEVAQYEAEHAAAAGQPPGAAPATGGK